LGRVIGRLFDDDAGEEGDRRAILGELDELHERLSRGIMPKPE
jgi:hypothetical protein